MPGHGEQMAQDSGIFNTIMHRSYAETRYISVCKEKDVFVMANWRRSQSRGTDSQRGASNK